MMGNRRTINDWRGWVMGIGIGSLLLLTGAACSLTTSAVPTEIVPRQPPTPTGFSVALGAVTAAPVVTATKAGQATADADTPQTPAATLDPCPSEPDRSPAQYEIATTINVQTRTVTTSMRASIRNDGDTSLLLLVLMVDSNRVPGAFTLTSVQGADGTAIERYTLTGPRLDILLQEPLLPRCRAAVTLAFTLALTERDAARLPYLSYTERQLNLGHWLPQFPPRLDGDWFIPREWTIGEYWTDELGDYEVLARVTGADGNSTVVIGPGAVSQVSTDTWEFKLRQGRSFTLAVSNAMTLLTTTTSDGLQIDLYTFTEGQPTQSPDGLAIDGPTHALTTARQTVEQFAALLGKLPYPRLVVIEGDFRDGMEFSGMVYVGHQWFKDYEGKPDSWLTLITAHEVVHQWWYSLVANDQNAAPLLDEALATYSEVLYLERHYPELVPWWWTFRVKINQPQGYVDARAEEFSSRRLYLNAVYLRGVTMLQAIREMTGDVTFLAWLQRYTEDNRGRIATLQDFWEALPAGAYAQIEFIRRQYLRDPDPLKRSPAATASGG